MFLLIKNNTDREFVAYKYFNVSVNMYVSFKVLVGFEIF